MTALVREPIYHQLNQLLRGLIRAGDFKAGAQFLTERQVGERFQVSRITANKALASLVAEGVLEFRKGVGTFVRGGVLDYNLAQLVSFTSKARAAGKKPRTRVVAWRTLMADAAEEAVREALAPAAGDALAYMERVRAADGAPIIFERRYVVLRLAPGLTRADAEGSLYEAFTARHGIQIAGADQRIRAVAIRGNEAQKLEVPSGTAGLLVTAVGFAAPDRPLWWEETLYRGDAYEFRTRIGPPPRQGPAVGGLVATGEAPRRGR